MWYIVWDEQTTTRGMETEYCSYCQLIWFILWRVDESRVVTGFVWFSCKYNVAKFYLRPSIQVGSAHNLAMWYWGSGGNSSTQMHKIKMLQIQTLKYKLSFAYVQLPVHPGVNLKTIHRRMWHPLMTTLEVYAQNKKSDTFQQWLMLETCPYTI